MSVSLLAVRRLRLWSVATFTIFIGESFVVESIYPHFRFITEARELPLEEKKNLFKSELGESILLQVVKKNQETLHKYTKQFGILDCRFDQREIKFDEARPTMEARYKQLFGEELKMAKCSNQTPMLPFKAVGPTKVCVNSIGALLTQCSGQEAFVGRKYHEQID